MALDLYCRCLNIRIHVDDGCVLKTWAEHIDDVASSDAFFEKVFLAVTPGGAEIQKKLRCLSHERTNKHWKINVCLNCGRETHAVSSKDDSAPGKVFVSWEMRPNTLTDDLVSSSKSYSPLYEVLVPTQPKEQSTSCLPLLPRNQLYSQIAELKAFTIQRLNAENEFLLERIRKFENEQMAMFNELQTQAQREQEALTQMLINHFSEGESEQSSSKPSSELPEAKIEPKRQKEARPVAVPAKKAEKLLLSPAKSSPAPKPRLLPVHESIFVMDDEETEEVPVDGSLRYGSESEPEEEAPDKVSDLASDDEAFEQMPENSFKLYATSLPIAISSHWKSGQRPREQDQTGGLARDNRDDPTWLAASIQALAMSVCGNDGTEMFGARPRPRLNTLD